jgi:hypothetical protein
MRIYPFIVAAGSLVVPHAVHAQATVGEKNSVSLAASYTLGASNKIVETEGLEIPNVDVMHHSLVFAAGYVTPLKGLAIEGQLPLVATQWDDSTFPHQPVAGEWDDGDLHMSPTDLRLGLRYQFLGEPVGAAVSLAGSAPVGDYPTSGYTAPARGLAALHAGIAVSTDLDPWVPRLYVYAGYEFSFVESYDEIPETEEFGQNRSQATFQLGYLVLDQLEIHATFDGMKTHGGIDFVDFDTYPEPVQVFHDGVLREDAYLLGGGLGYFLNDSVMLGADFRLFLAGANTRNANLFSVFAAYQLR